MRPDQWAREAERSLARSRERRAEREDQEARRHLPRRVREAANLLLSILLILAALAGAMWAIVDAASK